jgi:uncharacterized membrane protein YhaH (DUF805 family)
MTQRSQNNWAWFLFSFKGRISRKPYWVFNLIVFLGGIVLGILTGYGEEISNAQLALMLWILWPSLAVQAKRWHDTNKSAWWMMVNFIPIGGPIWALIENGFISGTRGPNRFGDDPLEDS